jgi:hypothetical protein
MRYNLESTLPIDAFSPRGGRGPFARGMTLEGGGGGIIGKTFGGIAKGITGAVKGVVQPVYNATLKNIPGVDNALVKLDKSVGKAIPGGWGTVAAVAASFIPGAQLAALGMTQTGLATGLGALSGSGVMRGNHEFNLQGAIMGGAMAYGSAELGQALKAAGNATPVDKLVTENIVSPNLTSAAAQTPVVDVNAGLAGTTPTSSISPELIKTAQSNIDPSLLEKMSLDQVANAPVLNTPTPQPTGLESLAQAGKGTLSNMGDAGAGIKNLAGFGSESGTAAAAREAFTNAGGTLTNTALPLLGGAAGLSAIEEQQKYLDEQLKNGALGQAEYNAAKAKIDQQAGYARSVVAANPLQTGTDLDSISEGSTSYSKSPTTLYDNLTGNKTLYAAGGEVQTNNMPNPPDDQTRQPNQTPISQIGSANPYNGLQSLFAGMQGFNTNQQQNQQVQKPFEMLSNPPVSQSFSGGFPAQLDSGTGGGFGNNSGYGGSGIGSQGALPLEGQYGIVKMAAGGMAPRFLSGGGDGMSDSIKASINGSQEARLADGEFVIPADVVSHIGNGSSKAGAKQLYSMMDRVRQARVGTKKQGKQINPRKFLAA